MTRPQRADPSTAVGFEAFLTARGPALLSMARGLMRTDADAEDLLHDTLTRALERWSSISRTGDPSAYVNRMLVNGAHSWWRRAVRRERATTPDDLVSAERAEDHPGTASAPEDRDALLRALRRLPARQRAVLVLRYYEDLPDQEIAHLLGIARASVRSAAARALTTVRLTGLLDAPAPRTPEPVDPPPGPAGGLRLGQP